MAMAKVTVSAYRGDSTGFSMTVLQGGNPADFTNALVRSELRAEPDGQLLGEWDIEVTGNTLNFRLSPKETELLPPTSRFDVEVDWTGDRSSVQTVAVGVLQTPPDITLPPTV